jgi:transcriptional regulator with XRE-family HTH domain
LLSLGLTVQEFADLIGKSTVTVNSLETGRLLLSAETAQTIAKETGANMDWLLADNPKGKPYVIDMEKASSRTAKRFLSSTGSEGKADPIRSCIGFYRRPHDSR